MTDPCIAALAEALGDLFPAYQRDKWPFTPIDAAAAIIAALPPDWCGHDAASLATHGWHAVEAHEIARLRKIEEAARAHIAWEYRMRGAPRFTMTMLRAALEADR